MNRPRRRLRSRNLLCRFSVLHFDRSHPFPSPPLDSRDLVGCWLLLPGEWHLGTVPKITFSFCFCFAFSFCLFQLVPLAFHCWCEHYFFVLFVAAARRAFCVHFFHSFYFNRIYFLGVVSFLLSFHFCCATTKINIHMHTRNKYICTESAAAS